MSDPLAYVWIVVGVIVAVLLPILADYIRRTFPPSAAESVGIPPWLKRYLLLFVFSLVVALVSLALWKTQHPSDSLQWFTAFMIGFGWESALEKFMRPTP
jgi:branched-subunit amino acid transport protein